MIVRNNQMRNDDEELRSLTSETTGLPSTGRYYYEDKQQMPRQYTHFFSIVVHVFIIFFAAIGFIHTMSPASTTQDVFVHSMAPTSVATQEVAIVENLANVQTSIPACVQQNVANVTSVAPSANLKKIATNASNMWDFQPNERCWDKMTFGHGDDNRISKESPDFENVFYNTSLSQCQGALSNMGDEGRMLRLADKLVNGECISVFVFGGSVTCGMDTDKLHTPALHNAYPAQFLKILNRRFPCGEHGNHTVRNLCNPGAASDRVYAHLTGFHYHEALKLADLIIVDTAVNDGGGDLQSKFANSKDGGETEKFNEAILRTFRTEYPQAATIWAAVGWRGWTQRNPPPYHTDTQTRHMQVLDYYRAPQLVVRYLLGPGHDPKVMDWLNKAWFVGGGIHPRIAGHRLIASTLMYTIRSVIARRDDIRYSLDTSPKWLDIPAVPWFLPKDWVFGKVSSIWLTNHRYVTKSGPSCGSGWTFDTDIPTKPKTLMTNVSDSCVVLDLTGLHAPGDGKKIKTLSLNFLHSYENYGKARVELYENTDCKPEPTCENRQVLQTFDLDCKWDSQTSQQSFTEITITGKQRSECNKYVRVCALLTGSQRLKWFSVGIKLEV